MKFIYGIAGFLLCVTSCDRPECKSTNPRFNEYPPTANEYKAELIKKLQTINLKEAAYWIDKYYIRENTEYMTVFVQGDGLCAKMLLNINNGTKLEHYKKVKGVSYSGAELTGLKYRIDSANNTYSFVYEDHSRIID